MKTQCPECGYTGNIRDDLIPEGGRSVGCPRCKATFTVRNDNPVQHPDTGNDTDRVVEVDGRDFIPFRQREVGATGERADRLVFRIAVLVLSFAAVFVVGFIIGRYTHNVSLVDTLKKRETAPVVVMTPVSPAEDDSETAVLPEVPVIPAETPGGTGDIDLSSEPLILEESFTSDVFLDITEIDGELTKTSDVTGLQRELELKEFAQGLVGNTLVGYFAVRDVGKLNSAYSKVLPLSLYSYYLEAEADSADSIKSVAYVGLKKPDELSSSLDRGSTVYIQGFIYSCTFVSDHFELGIVNPKVELSR
jgi:predicted Zn finger-like uncharacterized protein